MRKLKKVTTTKRKHELNYFFAMKNGTLIPKEKTINVKSELN